LRLYKADMNHADSGSNRHGWARAIVGIYLLLVVFSYVGIPGNPRGGGAWIPLFTIMLTLPWIIIVGNLLVWLKPDSLDVLELAFAVCAMINAAIIYYVVPRIWRKLTDSAAGDLN
jgi:hypothetical protein